MQQATKATRRNREKHRNIFYSYHYVFEGTLAYIEDDSETLEGHMIKLPLDLCAEIERRRVGEESRTQTARRILRAGLKTVKVEEGQ